MLSSSQHQTLIAIGDLKGEEINQIFISIGKIILPDIFSHNFVIREGETLEFIYEIGGTIID